MLWLVTVVTLCVLAIGRAQDSQQYVLCGFPHRNPNTDMRAGRRTATPGAWPWTVRLVNNQTSGAGTGVVISENVILTSAQHFQGSALDTKSWMAHLGDFNVSTEEDSEIVYNVRSVNVHPGYKAASLENDIALVILETPVVWNSGTIPACLPDGTAFSAYATGQSCFVSGWANMDSTGVMNQLSFPILSDSVCQQHWSGFQPSTQICAGHPFMFQKSCMYDVGSPLVCEGEHQAWYVQGIASSEDDCSKGDQLGAFTDVGKYVDWIKQTMREAGLQSSIVAGVGK